MINKVKCECGHVNPIGTVICEACGKVLVEEEKNKKLLDMRYEGTARRSQVYNRTLIDKIWNFFSSVKVGIVLIVITLIASAFGTVFPQVTNLNLTIPAEQYYTDRYGFFGQIYYMLGFHDLYRSWWYMLLVASIGVSLVICSLDRVVPLYKALNRQRVTRNTGFLKRQRLFNRTTIDSNRLEDQLLQVKKRLKKKRYQLREEDGNILAEKGRFSRWGPYINHIGLIIFLIGVLLRNVPGFYVNEQMLIKEGETKAIPGTKKEYYLTHHQFIMEFYDEDDNEAFRDALEKQGTIVKNFQSNVTLYKASEALPGKQPKLEKIDDYEIQVNKPLKYDRYALYQSTYRLNEIKSMTFALTKKDTGEEFGNITIDLANPNKVYELKNGYSVEILSYFPDFEFVDGEPSTKSPDPVNPAFAFKMITPDKPEGEMSFAAIKQTIEPFGENEYKMTFKMVDTVNYTGLTVRKDLTLWILGLGGLIFMIGVVQGSFWQHRRIWIKREDNIVIIAGHTNKNWFGLTREIEHVLENTNLPIPVDQSIETDTRQGVSTGG